MNKTTKTIDSELKAVVNDVSLVPAREAYNRVTKSKNDRISDLVRQELRDCSAAIDDAVRQEYYKTELEKVINQRTIDCLKELGYDVQTIQEKSFNGIRKTIISWNFGEV